MRYACERSGETYRLRRREDRALFAYDVGPDSVEVEVAEA